MEISKSKGEINMIVVSKNFLDGVMSQIDTMVACTNVEMDWYNIGIITTQVFLFLLAVVVFTAIIAGCIYLYGRWSDYRYKKLHKKLFGTTDHKWKG